MKHGFLQANNGAKSSKRLWGSILNFNDLDDAADMLLYIGSGLLGAGLFEGLRKK